MTQVLDRVRNGVASAARDPLTYFAGGFGVYVGEA